MQNSTSKFVFKVLESEESKCNKALGSVHSGHRPTMTSTLLFKEDSNEKAHTKLYSGSLLMYAGRMQP